MNLGVLIHITILKGFCGFHNFSTFIINTTPTPRTEIKIFPFETAPWTLDNTYCWKAFNYNLYKIGKKKKAQTLWAKISRKATLDPWQYTLIRIYEILSSNLKQNGFTLDVSPR